jgi:Lrp/AsnC family transcriptional regulator for asnA, asnC and gidA
MKTEYKSETLDQADLKLLGHLRTNARDTLTRISQETEIPISSIFDKLKRLEKMNVIKKYTSLLGLNKIGIHVRVLLMVKADKSSKENLEDWLMEKLPVNWLIRINGEWKLAAECLFPNIKNLESFIEDFEKSFKGVQFSVHHIMEDLKKESFLAGEAAPQDKSIE